MSSPPAGEERVLVLTPAGRDAEMVCERLRDAGLRCAPCGDLTALLEGIGSGAGAVLVAQEALAGRGAERLLATLDAQEPWSDLPVVLLVEAETARGSRVPLGVLERANVTLLPRPTKPPLLLSAVRSALRARRRQYETRGLLVERQRAVQLSDLFVGILGHDLRSPLSTIRISAESIARMPDAAALLPAGRILSASERMARMIEQLLDLARARNGEGIPVEPRPVDLTQICESAAVELQDPRRKVTLRAEGDLRGEWDPDRIRQVIDNLLGNAVAHGMPGTPVVVSLDGTDPDRVRLAVSNQGVVPEGALATVFDAFKSGGRARGGSSGLGLGLFIVREVVRAHGGDVEVRSSPGSGTTFEAWLPRHRPR